MTKDKLEQQLHELQKEKNLLQEEKNKQLGSSVGNCCFVALINCLMWLYNMVLLSHIYCLFHRMSCFFLS
jgi:hypothetical protein